MTPPVVMLMYFPLSVARRTYAAVFAFSGTVRTSPMLSLIEPLAEIVAAVNVPVSVGDADRTTLPVPVLVVTPVPPFATARVPARVMAPVVAVAGVNPVKPPLKEVTPVLVTLTAPVADVLVLRPELVVRDVTPVLVNVTAPVAAETPIPVFATAEVTPVLVIVTVPVEAETLTPLPATKEVTLAAGAELAHVVPLLVNKFPLVPGAIV